VPSSPEPGVAAFILAGGKSSRMGENKALLTLDGQTLLEIALGKARQVAAAVTIVGPRARFGNDAIEDIFPNCGPLGGIHAALAQSHADFNLIFAVDTPLVETRFLSFLLEQAKSAAADVTVPRTVDGFQPLCAVYRKSFRASAEAALKEHHYKIDALFPRVSLRVIEQAEMLKFAFDPVMFQNLNTRAEYERAKSRAR
jgi:molybdopterin-guanine dinucleotide biosynthesis protein A